MPAPPGPARGLRRRNGRTGLMGTLPHACRDGGRDQHPHMSMYLMAPIYERPRAAATTHRGCDLAADSLVLGQANARQPGLTLIHAWLWWRAWGSSEA